MRQQFISQVCQEKLATVVREVVYTELGIIQFMDISRSRHRSRCELFMKYLQCENGVLLDV